VSKKLHEDVEAWEDVLARRLPLLGHRNWIVVADSAYPAQSNAGIETVATGADHIEVLATILKVIAACAHVRANVLIDAELKFVDEKDVPGVTALRQHIYQLVDAQTVRELDHEQIISRLDESGKLFHILIFKSTLTIPYSSVFLELDCGYWNSASELRLRNSLVQALETQDFPQSTDQIVKLPPRFSGPFSRAR
jgi:L-fucose mutarotase/ribose pyranase (RbsD/FucU family)